MPDTHLIKVKVRDNQHILFEGEVDRISSFNEVGVFDVYPLHANFISIIQKKVSLIYQEKVIKEFVVEQAVMKVKQDVVHIFLGIEAFVVEDKMGTPAKTSP